MTRPIVVFDVNETLLDLEAIHPFFDRIFNDHAAMRLWFANLIAYSEALTLASVYVPFTDIGEGGGDLEPLLDDRRLAELAQRVNAPPGWRSPLRCTAR